MRALVVFESMFGNTQRIAQAVAEGLAGRMQVELLEVGQAPEALPADVGLLVLGGPTHALSMSRPSTRSDAAGQAAPAAVVSSQRGIREWLDQLAPAPGVRVATFDTRVRPPRLPGSAARAAERRLRGLQMQVVARATSFWVVGSQGPLRDGEVERARSWGAEVAERIGAALPHRS